jgi:hypothetical protein
VLHIGLAYSCSPNGLAGVGVLGATTAA